MRSKDEETQKAKRCKDDKGSSAQVANEIGIIKLCAKHRKMEKLHDKSMRGVGK